MGRPLGSARYVSARNRAAPARAQPPATGPFGARVRDGDPRVTTIYGAGGAPVLHLSTAGCNVNSRAMLDWVLAAMNAKWNMEANQRARDAAFRYDPPEAYMVDQPTKGSKFP